MVFEKPLIDARELRRALDPIHGRGEGELDRFQDAGFLSTGISTGDRGRQVAVQSPGLARVAIRSGLEGRGRVGGR
jgi:hypothetical protein